MSAYITMLDILGFDGEAASWTSKVNTIEKGGSGGGAMSAACFTLDTTPSYYTQTETAEFLADKIKLNKEVLNQGGYPVELLTIRFYLTMTVTPEFSGLFPDSITLHYIGDSFSEDGVQQDFNFSVNVFDSDGNTLAEAYRSYGSYYGTNPPLDTDLTLSLIYPEGSNGFSHIIFADQSQTWS